MPYETFILWLKFCIALIVRSQPSCQREHLSNLKVWFLSSPCSQQAVHSISLSALTGTRVTQKKTCSNGACSMFPVAWLRLCERSYSYTLTVIVFTYRWLCCSGTPSSFKCSDSLSETLSVQNMNTFPTPQGCWSPVVNYRRYKKQCIYKTMFSRGSTCGLIYMKLL